MRVYDKGIQTNRAFIAFDNIQHISWKYINNSDIECKIYSSAGTPIIQTMHKNGVGGFDDFLDKYREFMGCV